MKTQISTALKLYREEKLYTGKRNGGYRKPKKTQGALILVLHLVPVKRLKVHSHMAVACFGHLIVNTATAVTLAGRH